MKATQQLHDLGQSLWLDNITRGLLTSGTLGRYIGELSVTGLTSNPTIFDHAIRNGDFYDDAIRRKALAGKREMLASTRWQKLADAGARPQRLLWASTGTKDPDASDTLYIEALAAPDTINTMPENTLLAFAEHGEVKGVLPFDGGDAEALLAEFAQVGVDDAALAVQLQHEGARSFTQSWNLLMDCIASTSAVLTQRAGAVTP